MLLNLADYRKLTVPLLDGLSRLLELLSANFNVTLGEKLMEHLQNLANPEMLQKLRYEVGLRGRTRAKEKKRVALRVRL